MIVLYTATLFWGVIGTLAALAMIRVQTVLDAWWLLAGVFGGGVLGLFLLGRLTPRSHSANAVMAVVAGVVLIMWMSLSQSDIWPLAWDPYRSPFDGFLTIVFGTLAILGVGFGLFWIRPGSQSDS